MGRDKATMPHPGGGTFLQHAVDRLRVGCEEVVVSISPEQSTDRLEDVDYVVDPLAHQGPILGVATCLKHARQHGFAGCLCTPVDMPELTIEDLRPLRDAWSKSPDQLVCAIDSVSGHLQPLVAIYPTRFAESLRITAASDDRSLFRWIERQSPIRVSLPPQACRNVNTPEEL
jgi:molybdopterin-guanine dinucleotide biosynthesis protein A